MLWLSLIGIAIMTTIVSCKVQPKHETRSEQKSTVWESSSFFPYYIISMHEQHNSLGDKCYWLIYDDIDSGFDNEVISMDEYTYHIIYDIWKVSMKADRYCVNEHNANLLNLLDKYQPVIYNDNGTAIIRLNGEW